MESQNERNAKIRHTERNRSIPDLLSSRKTCPDKSSLILKKPKTKKSNRVLYMTKPLKEELQAWLEKISQNEQNAPEKYSNCGQLFRLPDGLPIAPELLTKWYRLWRAEHPEFEQIVFHGLRHSSATYQLLQDDCKLFIRLFTRFSKNMNSHKGKTFTSHGSLKVSGGIVSF